MAAKNAENFTHTVTLDDGSEKTITLKNFGRVPAGLIRKNRKNTEEAMWALIEWGAATPDDLDVFDQIPLDEVESLFVAWQEWSQVTVGESSSSST